MEEETPFSYGDVAFLSLLQLAPELSELLSGYDRVCFVDAHTGSVPDDVHSESIGPRYQPSPFTHHLTPHSLLAMTESIYKKSPESILVSVRGYEFGFDRELSKSTAALVPLAVALILKWLHQ